MSYIETTYILKVELKDDANWDSLDTNFVDNKISALAYELENIVGDKFEVKVERR